MAPVAGRPAAGVLFDLDGVIVDSRRPVALSLNHMLEQHGRAARPDDELHPWIGAPIHDIVAGLFGDGTTDDEVDAGTATFRAHYDVAKLEHTTVQPGMAELLAELAGRATLVVATSKPKPSADSLLEHLGLAGHFHAIVGPELSARSEPKKVTMERAVAALNGQDVRVMVGDTPYDVVAGHHHGLPVVGVTWGIGTADQLAEAGADAVVDTPQQLGEALG